MEYYVVPSTSVSSSKRSQGFSLVELMVALVIGLIIVLGAGQLFITSKRTYSQMEELATRQHNLRALYDFISLDVRTATSASVNADGSLVLYYEGVRQNDPSCGGVNLISVKYFYASPSVIVGVQCGSETDPATNPYTTNALVDGVETLFFPSLPPSLSYVETKVKFEGLTDEPTDKSSFSFVVALRCAVFENCAS